LLAANADEIDTLLTMLKLRDDWQGRPHPGVWRLRLALMRSPGS
jgi:hypothetical protein